MSGSTSQWLDREHLAGPPEAGLDLVGDEQDPVLAGDLAEARQEARRRDDVAALAEDRLDDDRRHPVRVDELVEGQVELRLPVAGAGVGRVGAAGRPIAVRVGRVVDGPGQRLESAAIDVLGGRQRHRLGGPAVVAVAEGEDGRPAGGDPGQLDGRLDRLGARVRQERLPRPARQDRPQPVVEPQAGLVVQDVLLAVEQLRGLRRDGGGDPRMGMAGVGDPDPRRVVEVALAVAGDQPRALAAVDVEVRDPAPDRRHDRMVGERRGLAPDIGLEHVRSPVLSGYGRLGPIEGKSGRPARPRRGR